MVKWLLRRCVKCGKYTFQIDVCPFCGSEASYGQILTGQNEGGEYIECFDCGATSRLIFPLDGDVKELLKELWNARAGLS